MTTNNPLRGSYSGIAATTGFAGNKVVLLNAGSYPGSETYLNNTSKFSGTDWTNTITNIASGPLPTRKDVAMCYDGYNALVYGGRSENEKGVMSDTWTIGNAGTSWTKEAPATVPFGRYQAKLALLNVAAPKAIMVGGASQNELLNETWQWDGNLKSWLLLNPATKPAARSNHMFAGGPTNCVLFGGKGTLRPLGDTLSFNGTTWTVNTPTTPPSARFDAAFAYDVTNGIWVLFGGNNGYEVLNDVWTLDANRTAWTRRAPTTSPPARVGASMCWDSQSATVIMTGGNNGDFSYNDTWSFNGSTFQWAQL